MAKALVVDNKRDDAERLRKELEEPSSANVTMRFRPVDCAYTGESAVEMARCGGLYELILLDMQIPWTDGGPEHNENGFRACEQIRILQPHSHIIVVTGYASMGAALKMGQRGADLFLEKPVSEGNIHLVAEQAIRELAKEPERILSRLRETTITRGRIHDAKNALNNIVVAIGNLQDTCNSVSRFVAARDLPSMLVELGRIRQFAGLIQDTLTAVETGQRSQPDDCDLHQIVSSSVSKAGILYGEAGQSVRMHIGETVPRLRGAREELEQIVFLLVSNALQATAPGGHVDVSVRSGFSGRAREVLLSIADDGPGLAPHVRERLFQPEVSTRGEGHGHGLFLARVFARNHGGSIEWDSSGGKGTCFTVRLPAAEIGDEG